jgi:hypothetical protein
MGQPCRRDLGDDSDRAHRVLGPMAYTVIGGLMVATLLTLVFLPALYVAWFRFNPRSESELAIPAEVPALAQG